jgi:hypothetical protein
VNQGRIRVGAEQAIQVDLRSVGAVAGVGCGVLRFDLEVTTRTEAVDGAMLSVRGVAEVKIGGIWKRLAAAEAQGSEIVLGSRGDQRHCTLVAQVADRQLQLVEEGRTGDLQLRPWLSGWGSSPLAWCVTAIA